MAVTSIVVIAFVIPLAVLIQDLAADRALNAAERDAQTVARLAASVGDESADIINLTTAISSSSAISVVTPGPTTFGSPLPNDFVASTALTATTPIRIEVAQGQSVVVPVFRASDQWAVVVTVPSDVLNENVTNSWIVLIALGVALVGLAAFVADRLGRSVTRPIEELVAATHELGRGNTAVRVTPGGPSELQEVGQAFNRLTERVRFLLVGERENVADLAHRLRTPLTALKLNLESAEATGDLGAVSDDVAALERTVSELINEGRRPIREGISAHTDLRDVVQRRCAFWGALADEQERTWSVSVPDEETVVGGSTPDHEALLDALLGNIFAHTPPPTAYGIKLSNDESGITLQIHDEGPGFGDVELLKRGRSGADSTGLGSDIVRRTVNAGGGSVRWDHAPGTGTTCILRWPLDAI